MKWGRYTDLGPGFRFIWASVAVSGLGSGMRFVALPLLAAEMTSDPRKVSLVSLAGQLPWPLVMLYAGVIADRFDRRRVMYTVDAARAGVAGALAAAVAFGETTLLLLMTVAALLDLGQRFYTGAWAGMVPAVVAPTWRDRGNAALQGSSVVATLLVGNPVGAFLFDVDHALPFTFDALSFAVAALLIFLLKGDFRLPHETGPGVRKSFRQQAADGFRLLWGHPVLRRIVVLSALFNLVGAAQIAIGVLFAKQDLGLSSTGFGFLVAAFGAGSLVASVFEERLVLAMGKGRLLVTALVTSTAAAVSVGLSESGGLAGVFTALYGASTTFWTVTVTTVRQDCVPAAFMGRVTMTHKTVVRAAATLGAAAGGIVAHALGLRSVFLIGAVLLLAGVLSGGRLLLRHPLP
ncbi:MFS transporter [Streptomyces sp. NPDC059169]|uniref:MFS transporter n=1 Tax=unclassified Streptomyces TaxID=2593676 RepID=UPI0036CC34A6